MNLIERIKAALAKKAEAAAQAQAILDGAYAGETERDLTEDEQKQFDGLTAEGKSLEAKIANLTAMLDSTENVATAPDANQVVAGDAAAAAGVVAGDAAARRPRIEFPSLRGTLRCFEGEANGRSAQERAYRFGRWLQATAGLPGPRRWCAEHGLPVNELSPSADAGNISIGADYSEGINTSGGFLVLPEFDADIIRLVIKYGKFRQKCRVVPMGSDTKSRPRRTSGLDPYFVGEGQAGTQSTGGWDRVNLTAKKLMVLSLVTNELRADAMIDMADNLAFETAAAFAKKEDQCGFIGTGVSTYGGITGLTVKLLGINGVDNGGGLVLGAGDLMSEITLANLNDCLGLLPDMEGLDDNAEWYSSKFFYFSVMQRLEAAAGGNTWQMIEQGSRTRRLCLGYPVNWTETLPKTNAASQILALFGDLSRSSDMGDRAQITISLSDSATVGTTNAFEVDELAFRATERFDINNHDLGDATNAGPVIALISAAS